MKTGKKTAQRFFGNPYGDKYGFAGLFRSGC